MTVLRLLADDLTGALDTAAELVPLTGPVATVWHGKALPQTATSLACETGTRELAPEAAAARVASLAGLFTGADIAFKKIDSLLRGPTLAELAACLAEHEHAVLAPAFPFQRRITSGARQHAVVDGAWRPVGPDLVAALRALGVKARAADDGALRPGVTVFDARSDADLRAVVVRVGREKVLWCGTGGLAQALAGTAVVPAQPALKTPVLGLFGSDQAVTAAQLAACAPHWCEIDDAASGAALIERHLARHGVALASHNLPAGLDRGEAARRIGEGFAALLPRLQPPGTLIVAGGETLRGLCLALGAERLDVQGRFMPGVPRSIMRGGAWDGVTVVSKSGAFGQPDLLRDLLRLERIDV